MRAPRPSLAAPLALLAALLWAPAATAAPTPAQAWSLQSLAAPTNFHPGDESGLDSYQIHIANSGGEITDGSTITIVDTLPKGLVVKSATINPSRSHNSPLDGACTTQPGEVATVSCEIVDALRPAAEPTRLYPGDELFLKISVATPAGVGGPLVNRVEVKGGGAPPLSIEAENLASAEDAQVGFEEFHATLTGPDGLPAGEAASHPFQYTTTFAANLAPSPPGSRFPLEPAGGDLKDIEVALPPGLAGNPTATGRCSAQDFNTIRTVVVPVEGNLFLNECPESSVVGLAMVQQMEAGGANVKAAIYNLIPPQGMPAQLGFQVLAAPIYVNTRVRSEGDFGISGYLENVTEAARVTAGRFSFWGTPWDKLHDTMRGECGAAGEGEECKVAGTARPFLRLPSSCENPLLARMSVETWARPAATASVGDISPAPVGCAAVPFGPAIESRPTTNVADSPSGLHFRLHLPQRESEEPEGRGQADLREAVVRLPQGLVVNPAAANGRDACSLEQIGFSGFEGARARFDAAPARCPAASKVGRVEVVAPAVDHPLTGSVYLARQSENPFKSLLAIYIVFEDPQSGIVIKLAGEVTPDPASGQLSTTVADSPQLPFEDFTFDFFEGPRAPLRTPMSCGPHTTTTQMTPWSAPAGAVARPADSFQIASGPAGPCPTGALAPKLSAGLANPTAATYSPFSVRVTRPDGSGEITGLTTTTPTGLAARLAGIPYCGEAQIAQAASRQGAGQGAVEAASPSCPAASRIGSTTAGAGAGPAPFFTSGEVYLAGPYKGARLSLVAIVPALAGPFDLGVVVDRIALHLDLQSAQVTATADPLPRLLAGVPIDLRDIRVNLDRKDFTLAPTSCAPKAVTATVSGPAGQATVSDRFQVGGCRALGFRPQVSLKLKGGTRRGDHPELRSVVTYPKGAYANIAKAVVTLPPTELIDNAHIQNPCTRVQFNAHQCPKGSILGYARAFTPLLDKPLEGPVYFRSNGGERLLPDIVADLDGQLHVIAVGFVKSSRARIRTTFATVPDAPLSKFTLNLKGGKKGLLVNNRDICAHPYRVGVKLTAHNGRVAESSPLLKTSCGGKGRGR